MNIQEALKTCGSVVVIKPCCGSVVYIASDLPEVMDAEAQQEIGALVAQGCRVEHWSRQETKEKDWKMGCKCQSPIVAGEFNLKFVRPQV